MSGGCSVSTVIRAQTKCVRMILPSSLSAVAKVSDPVCQEDVPVCRRKSVRPLCQEDVPVCRHEVSDLLCQKCSCLLSRKLRSTVSERFTRFPPGKCGCEIWFFWRRNYGHLRFLYSPAFRWVSSLPLWLLSHSGNRLFLCVHQDLIQFTKCLLNLRSFTFLRVPYFILYYFLKIYNVSS